MAAGSFLLMWLALAALCAFFACRQTVFFRLFSKGSATLPAGLPADVLPLTVLCAVVLVLVAAGCLQALRAGMILVLTAAALAAGLLVLAALRGATRGDGGLWRQLADLFGRPAWLLAFGGSLLLAGILAVSDPLFTQWDEFSFWGTAAKVVKQTDALYTAAGTNLAARSYPPALPVLGYAFAFASPAFRPWLLLAGYGVLSFFVFGAVLGAVKAPTIFEKKLRAAPDTTDGEGVQRTARARRTAAAFGALALVLAPFAVESWYANQQLMAYTTAYADLMLGELCAGGIAVWYAATAAGPLRGRRLAAALAAVACVTAVLGLTKDVGLPLGLVIMLVCGLDCLAVSDRQTPLARRLGRAALVLAVLLAAAVLAYAGWSVHLAAALGQDRSQTGGSAQLSTVGMLAAGVRELLGIGRSEKFSAVLSAMLSAFFGRRVSVFGSGLGTLAALAALLGLAYWLAGHGARRRVVGFAAAAGAGYLGYTFFQLLCYVYVFSDVEGRNLVSYERYMSTYYLFWLLGALCLLLLCARRARPAAPRSLLATAAVLLAFCCLRIRPQQTLLARPATFWDMQTLIGQRAAQALAAAGTDDMQDEKVFLVSQWDTGARWYAYAYALEPLALLRLPGDATVLVPGETQPVSYADPLCLDRQSMADFLQTNGCTLLLMDVDDDDFHREFAPLFSDGLAGFERGEVSVYRIVYEASGVRFVPWEEAAHD